MSLGVITECPGDPLKQQYDVGKLKGSSFASCALRQMLANSTS